ncbi:hypothetical protein [Kineococcus sp. SYSU DK005]|uniref:hypothetical protein n=1 Tax=Kineococcus sp. SYSU DK005 TaxID=3383126 RepID=UPI003D7C6389
MHAPDADDLRPGDAVKVRGTGSPLHTGAKAVVAAVHRDPAAPHRAAAVDVRYTARGRALRVDLAGPGELVRFADPWPQRAPEHREAPAGGAAAGAPPPASRRALAALGAVLVLGGLAVGLAVRHEGAAPPNPLVVRAELAEAARGSGPAPAAPGLSDVAGTATPSTSSPTSSPTASPAAASSVVAWAAGPVPVVAGGAGAPRPVPLAGVRPAPGCRDAYAAALLDLLPLGTAVEVTGSGWYRTGDGLQVQAELVRQGLARPGAAGAAPGDAAAAAALALVEPEGDPGCG